MGSRTIIVTGATFPEATTRKLEAGGFQVKSVPGDLDEEGIIGALQGAWGYVLGGSERMSKNSWSRLPDLAMVCFLGTGYESFIELPDYDSPVRFTYTPHANASAVAEFSIAQMIDLVRGISRNVTGIRSGQWSEEATPSLIGARLGVVGMGHIGREVARMAHAAFGTEIFYWNRSRRPELDALPYTPVPALTDLFEAADVVSVNIAHEPGVNDGVIGTAQLTALGADGFLVNTARAALLDPVALRTALSESWISGASIDGYYIEPTPPLADDPYGLLKFIPDRLLVTPHNAYLSRQAIRKMAEMAVENILAVARGDDPPYEAATASLRIFMTERGLPSVVRRLHARRMAGSDWPTSVPGQVWNSVALRIVLVCATVGLASWIAWGPRLRHAYLYPKFGDLGEWAGAAGSLAAVAVALVQTHRLRMERIEDLRRQHERERSQVFSWIVYRESGWWAYFNNLTHTPIGVWVLRVEDAATGRQVTMDVTTLLPILPGFTQHPVTVDAGDLLRPMCRLEFSDSAGTCWLRDASGGLRQIPEIRLGNQVLAASTATDRDRRGG